MSGPCRFIRIACIPSEFGWLDQTGGGDGVGRTVRVPLPPGCGDATYLAVMAEIIEPLARQFGPDLILISAGQDASSATRWGACV